MKTTGLMHLSMVIALMSTGCMTGMFERTDEYSSYPPGSDEWWAEKALLPPGVRQKCWKGKNWPVRPRSTQERQQFTHTYHSEHYWPLPYTCQDRQYVNDIMAQQEMLGWQEETTLHDRFFAGDPEQLTRAGQLHLDYILHVAPPHRRTVYVQSTYNPARDQVRLATVESYIANHNLTSSVPVIIRETQEVGRAATEVGRINSLYNNSIAPPRLGSSGGGGGGASAPPSSN